VFLLLGCFLSKFGFFGIADLLVGLFDLIARFTISLITGKSFWILSKRSFKRLSFSAKLGFHFNSGGVDGLGVWVD
jgi:hypothetical protein